MALATLLPNGQQTFEDNNGNPLAGGSVYFYIPNTTTPKNTWQDSSQTTLNTNPVVLDSAGRAIIYGNGSYRQIVKDSVGNTIWDRQTDSPATIAYVDQSVANIGLPPPSSAHYFLRVKGDLSGYELQPDSSVLNRTALAALNVTVFTCAFLEESGREGPFILRTGTPPVTDTQQGIYVPSSTNGYYWQRAYVGMASVSWFGAVGDGTTDDTAAFQGALDVTKFVQVPYRSAGYVVSGVNVPQGAMMIGARGTYTGAQNPTFGAQMSTLIAKTGASYILGISSFDLGTPVHLEHLRFDGNGTTATAVRFRTSLAPVLGVRLLHLSFYQCYEAIGDEASTSNNVVEIYADDIQCNVPTNRQIYLRRSGGLITFRNVKIDYTNNTGNITWEGARFEQVAGIELEKFDVIGWGTGTTYQPAAIGIVIAAAGGNGASVWLRRVLCDSLHGPGVLIDTIYNVQAEQLSAGLCWGTGLDLENCTYGSLSDVFVYGAKASPGSPNTAQGLRLSGCSNMAIGNLNIKDVNGPGYVLNNSVSCKVMGGIIRDNVGTGILEAGTANANLNAGMTIVGNASTLTQVGTISATVNYVNGSSVYTQQTLGPATIA